jgi:hypothetical protein
MVVWVVVMAVDPRVQGFNPLAGGYERDARASITDARARLGEQRPADASPRDGVRRLRADLGARTTRKSINTSCILSSCCCSAATRSGR